MRLCPCLAVRAWGSGFLPMSSFDSNRRSGTWSPRSARAFRKFPRLAVRGPVESAAPAPRTARRGIKHKLRGVLALVALIWAVYLVGNVFPLEKLGLVPRNLLGMAGIVAMPLLHSSLGHLLGNTVPLLVLLALLAGTRTRWWQVVAAIVLCSGGLLWAFGRPGVHIGASGLVFGLITFLIAWGFIQRRPIPLIVSLLVGCLYGTTLLRNIFPYPMDISWDGHLCGAAAGVAAAYGFSRGTSRQEA